MKSRIVFILIIIKLTCSVSLSSPTNILVLDTSDFDTQVLNALSDITYTEVSPSGFLSVNLNNYDVLYVGSTFQNGSVTAASQDALNALNTRNSDIADFISNGHGLIALTEPIGAGVYTWLPDTVTSYGSLHQNIVNITEPTHPLMDGLTNEGLSNWGSSYHNYFLTTGSFTVLAVNENSNPLILVEEYGSGWIILSCQDVDFHYVYSFTEGKQYVEFMQNAVEYTNPVIPAPGAFILGSLGAGFVSWLRRKRAI